MARGVTQEQVNEAIEQLLLAGERPTIERVRATLGTGSPNTLTRMLDTWWKGLGDRLTAQRRSAAVPEAPAAVVDAASALWEAALAAGQAHAEAAVAQLREHRRHVGVVAIDQEGVRMIRPRRQNHILLIEMLKAQARHLGRGGQAADHQIKRPFPQQADQIVMRASLDREHHIGPHRTKAQHNLRKEPRGDRGQHPHPDRAAPCPDVAVLQVTQPRRRAGTQAAFEPSRSPYRTTGF